MTKWLVDPNDSLARQNEKLREIAEVLMRRVEQDTDRSGVAYAQFERAALLEDQVRQRTQDLEHALDLLNESNARLAEANRDAESARADLATAIETIQEGFALFNADEEMVMCNSRFGMHMPDLQPSLRAGLSFKDYITLVSRSPHLALPDGVTPKDWSDQRLARHAERHVIFNVRMSRDRWVQVSEHRTKDGGTVILQTDVTDMMRLEREEREKLLDNQAKVVRATLDHINQGVCIFDQDARLVGWNRKIGTMLAVPVHKFQLGKPFEEIFDFLKPDITFLGGIRMSTLLRWVKKRGGRSPLAFEIRRGDRMILDVFAQEMPGQGFVISITDVTAEREAAQTLFEVNELLEQRVMERTLELEDALATAERANASKARFVAAASHDLLQPLSAAKLYVSALDGPDAGDGTREIASKAQNALASAEQIIDALLDISKLEAGMAALEIQSVALEPLMASLRDEFAPAAAQKNLELRVVPCSLIVESDPAFLRRIFANLIANAVRYTDAGRVLFGARRTGGSIRLEVWDTGPGIPEEDQDTIFKEFQRLNAKASASEGLGLGLAIVERACAQLGHPMGLWSVVGRGSGFFVNVPQASQGYLHLGDGGFRRSRATFPGAGLIVLLVENDLDLRRAMTLLLEKWDVSVLDAHDASEALELLSEIEIAPDAMLVDYQLSPEMTGLKLIEKVRQAHGDVPTRLITANRSSELRRECASVGVEMLNKPIDPRSLERFLATCLEARP